MNTPSNAMITIPNSIITEKYIVNWNKLTTRRFDFVLNLSMHTSTEKVKETLEKITFMLKHNPIILPETVHVNLEKINTYSLDISVFLYMNVTDYFVFLGEKEKILCDVLHLIEVENIELAYPTQTLYVKNNINEENIGISENKTDIENT